MSQRENIMASLMSDAKAAYYQNIFGSYNYIPFTTQNWGKGTSRKDNFIAILYLEKNN